MMILQYAIVTYRPTVTYGLLQNYGLPMVMLWIYYSELWDLQTYGYLQVSWERPRVC